PDRFFGSPPERARFRAEAVRRGLFRDFVKARVQGRTGAAPLLPDFHNARSVFEEWLAILFSEDNQDPRTYAKPSDEPAWPAGFVAEDTRRPQALRSNLGSLSSTAAEEDIDNPPEPSVLSTPTSPPVLRILCLSADPKGFQAKLLDREVRTIEGALLETDLRDRFNLRQEFTAQLVSLQSALLRQKPEIVHFRGHGALDGLFLEDETGQLVRAQGSRIARLLGNFNRQVRCVVLNACYSKDQAEAIAQNIDCVVGTPSAIGAHASRFAGTFYRALAFGNS